MASRKKGSVSAASISVIDDHVQTPPDSEPVQYTGATFTDAARMTHAVALGQVMFITWNTWVPEGEGNIDRSHDQPPPYCVPMEMVGAWLASPPTARHEVSLTHATSSLSA